jgi:hypothetical protein
MDLHNFNFRVQMIKEGQFDRSWMPAITGGVHYKYNEDIKGMNKDLSGTLRAIGVKDHEGWDLTLYASKMLTFLPRPVLVNLALRSTKAAQIGLLGFTDDGKTLFEGSAVVFLTGRLALAGEYRQKPDEYNAVPGLIKTEDDWWTICAAYVFSNQLTLSGGYGHFGGVLNHTANNVWGIKTKWEF